MDSDLEKRVEKLEDELKEVKKEIGFLRRKYNELIDRIKSAGGFLVNAGKSKEGDDEHK